MLISYTGKKFKITTEIIWCKVNGVQFGGVL